MTGDRGTAYLAELTDEQRAAVQAETSQSVLVSAGAGTGKTRTLVGRVVHLIAEGIPPGRILAVTFTNRAAAQLRARVREVVGEHEDWRERVHTGTFHALGLRWIRRHAEDVGDAIGCEFRPDFTVIDEPDLKRVVRTAARESLDDGTDAKLAVDDAQTLLDVLDRHAWSDPDPEHLAEQLERDEATIRFEVPRGGATLVRSAADAVRSYRAYKLRHALVDYNDLIQLAVRAMRAAPHHRPGYDQVLVDEYQDTNRLQDEFLGLLREPPGGGVRCPLYAVGDEAQILYSWRGAAPENIRGLPDREQVRTQALTVNWRSGQRVLDAGNAVIAPAALRHFRSLLAAPGRGQGPPVEMHGYGDAAHEAAAIGHYVERCLKDGVRVEQLAVLARTSRCLLMVEGEITRRSIPYRLTAGHKFADRQEVKDVGAWLRVLVNPHDTLAMERVLTRPKRGIGEVAIRRLAEIASARGCTWLEAAPGAAAVGALRGRGREAMEETVRTVAQLHHQAEAGASPRRLVAEIGIRTGIRDRLERATRSDDEDEAQSARMRLERLHVLEQMAGRHRTVGALADRLSIADGSEDGPRHRALTLSTVHAAKGLEWPYVVLCGFEEGVLPVAGSDTPAEREEERRIAHVAFTRAQRRLVITYALRRHGQDCVRSSFADDLDGCVRHRRHYGEDYRRPRGEAAA